MHALGFRKKHQDTQLYDAASVVIPDSPIFPPSSRSRGYFAGRHLSAAILAKAWQTIERERERERERVREEKEKERLEELTAKLKDKETH